MSEYIDRDLALSHPYANGKYDKVHANIAFITGFESYKEWLETLPKADVISREKLSYNLCEGISCNECSFNYTSDGQCGCLLQERIERLLNCGKEQG